MNDLSQQDVSESICDDQTTILEEESNAHGSSSSYSPLCRTKMAWKRSQFLSGAEAH